MDICYYCGRPAECKHHLIFGTSGRALCDDDGIILHSCHKHHKMGKPVEQIHENPAAANLSKMLGQLVFEVRAVEKGHTREEAREMFRRRYGKLFYLEDD